LELIILQIIILFLVIAGIILTDIIFEYAENANVSVKYNSDAIRICYRQKR